MVKHVDIVTPPLSSPARILVLPIKGTCLHPY
jgi:hypothetical protein